jgi:hypothetical protein
MAQKSVRNSPQHSLVCLAYMEIKSVKRNSLGASVTWMFSGCHWAGGGAGSKVPFASWQGSR